MKKRIEEVSMRKKLVIAMLSIFLMGGSSSLAIADDVTVPLNTLLQSLPLKTLSSEEVNDLLHMREEEKLARDVYLTLGEYYSLPIFRNIAKSEQRHMDAIKALLEKYGIEDPVKDDSIGVFQDEELQNLYYQLVDKGKQSLVDALEVGATIEDLDIKDLEEAIQRTDNQDITFVYQNLMKGSRNHLRAFTRILERLGVNYEPQYISAEEYEQIVSTPHEMGPARTK